MVEFKDVSVTYSSGVDALNKINLKINDGDFAFVVGPSGAGKSTLIKLILKEIDATSGEVIVNDVRFEDLSLDIQSAVLCCEPESVQLSRKEFEVMKTFLYNPTMTITKDALISSVWGMDSEATDNNVEVYISFLRKKLKYLRSRVGIRNLQKIGYRLEVEPC